MIDLTQIPFTPEDFTTPEDGFLVFRLESTDDDGCPIRIVVGARGDFEVVEAWGELHERCILTALFNNVDDVITLLRLMGAS